ncbi:hypothetical protein DdX_11564 [Ditylenchus destructor]|uniref:Uncharacterized protein n=1 Tax=Ditylenchus destructor TaxID=166010 RepID=A0AAD4R460_9BILA|nr:hypothetical protein DdX_11564 [Ditylenchus destructor]
MERDNVQRQSYSNAAGIRTVRTRIAIPAYDRAESGSAPRLVSTDSVASTASTHSSETSGITHFSNHLEACLADREREEQQNAKRREREQQRRQVQDQSRHSIRQVCVESDSDPDVPTMKGKQFKAEKEIWIEKVIGEHRNVPRKEKHGKSGRDRLQHNRKAKADESFDQERRRPKYKKHNKIK